MTQDELVAQLAPIRVPVEFARFALNDALAMIALGLVAGVVASWCLGFFSRAVAEPADDLQAEIALLSGLDRGTRLARLATILRRRDMPLPEGMREALYDPAVTFDPAVAERALRAGGMRAP